MPAMLGAELLKETEEFGTYLASLDELFWALPQAEMQSGRWL